MNLSLRMKILETHEQLAADDCDLLFIEDSRFELRLASHSCLSAHQVQTAAACQVFHHNPEAVSLDEAAIVAGNLVRRARSQVRYFRLDLGDVILGCFKVLPVSLKNFWYCSPIILIATTCPDTL